MGIYNRDEKTGIRYGIGAMSENIQSWIYDELQPVYGDCQCEDEENCQCECVSNAINTDTLKAELTEYNELWVFYSEYVMPCRDCSPCAPGAGDISNPDEYGEIAYCLPPEYYVNPSNLIEKRELV